LNVLDLERLVSAVELVVLATTSLKHINGKSLVDVRCDLAQLLHLLSRRQKSFLPVFEEKLLVIETLTEIRLGLLFPLSLVLILGGSPLSNILLELIFDNSRISFLGLFIDGPHYLPFPALVTLFDHHYIACCQVLWFVGDFPVKGL
jgi:hypothetical protein